MTMNVLEVLDRAAQEQKKVVKILKKWISCVDCPGERDAYAEMIVWVKQDKSSAYYKKHAAEMQADINTLHKNATHTELAEDEKAVFNFISGLLKAHGGNE